MSQIAPIPEREEKRAGTPMIRLPGRRAVPEWIGAHADSEPPPHVKLRIWERENGRCHITGRKILPGDAFDYEHKKRIRDGGENRESNIFLALRDKHREKTGQENSDGAKADRVRIKHLGIKRPGRKIAQRADPWGKGRR